MKQELQVTKPFLKWVGGKTQILEKVLSKFPKEMENYHEPFLGGGSVLLGLLSLQEEKKLHVKGSIYASDINGNLIAIYKQIQKKPNEFCESVQGFIDGFQKAKVEGTVNREADTLEEALTSRESYYYWIRRRFNSMTQKQRESIQGTAMFLFLNKTCFRGVYREGPNGFNVPYGHYENPGILHRDDILKISRLMKNVVFIKQGFEESLKKVKETDFVYLDPPYAPETETSFVSYVADGFTLEKHKLLFQEIAKKKYKFLLSNAEVKLVKDAFPQPSFITEVISCRRAIHSKTPDAKTNEVLICN
jgi:DNA adenine methylase